VRHDKTVTVFRERSTGWVDWMGEGKGTAHRYITRTTKCIRCYSGWEKLNRQKHVGYIFTWYEENSYVR